MKKRHLILFALTIAVGACRNTATMSSSDQIVSDIYTAGILTLETQTQAPTFTPTPLPVFTATPTTFPTLVPTLTLPTYAPIENHTAGLWQNSSASTEVDHSLCDNSAYIEDITIPDGTVFAPGEIFIKSWMLKNTGFCMWKDSYKLKFFEGDSMSGLETEIGKTGSLRQSDKSFHRIDSAGHGRNIHRLLDFANKYDYPFGTPFFVQIVVKN